MIELSLIGIGTGNPDHLTRAAEAAMRAADLVLLPRKRAETTDLLDLRRSLCTTILPPGAAIAEFDLPERDADAPYRAAVDQWHDRIAHAWVAQIASHLPDGGKLALLVWGDPSLYDSSLRIAERVSAGGLPIRLSVVPGITSLQALTAAHTIPLNEIGAPVLVTTGRRLLDGGWPEGVDTVAVMLDGRCAFAAIDPTGLHIWWGAYLGMKQQALAAGPLADMSGPIRARRAALRAEHGWIMDTYLLRRRSGQSR